MSAWLHTLVYCARTTENASEILLLKRHKEPNLGLWVAPGGKIEFGESPQECALRELREESGLIAQQIELRAILTLVLPELKQPCLQFLYWATQFHGTIQEDRREGALQWWSLEQIAHLPMPPMNRLVLPHLIDHRGSLYQAKYIYDANLQIVKVVEG